MVRRNSSNANIGFILIFIGVFMLLAKIGLISDMIFLYLVAGGFFLTYFMLGGSRHYGNIGFLIPGSVITAVALFADVEDLPFFHAIGGGVFFIFLAGAFLLVLLHTRQYTNLDWSSRNWPIFPAGGLAAFGCFVLLVEHENFILGQIRVLNTVIPLALICIGLYLYFKSKHENNDD